MADDLDDPLSLLIEHYRLRDVLAPMVGRCSAQEVGALREVIARREKAMIFLAREHRTMAPQQIRKLFGDDVR